MLISIRSEGYILETKSNLCWKKEAESNILSFKNFSEYAYEKNPFDIGSYVLLDIRNMKIYRLSLNFRVWCRE
jgi:hypothetical protein